MLVPRHSADRLVRDPIAGFGMLVSLRNDPGFLCPAFLRAGELRNLGFSAYALSFPVEACFLMPVRAGRFVTVQRFFRPEA